MQALIFIEAHGKAVAWERITDAIRMKSRVIATGGHICGFPSRLTPLGIDIKKGHVLDPGRQPDPRKTALILSAVREAPASVPILIATDDDVEGDVIAFDVIDIILANFPDRASRMVRVRPGPITVEGVRAALSSATRISGRRIVSDAVQGRTRAVTDRWIGATFSKIAGVPVGRVRSALLGATFLLNKAPDRLRELPETGEITFQARSASGGRYFIARVALSGFEPPEKIARLVELSRRFEGLLVPGAVRPLEPMGAAIAPRVGTVRPFNTADALAYASRHHGVSSSLAMRGLQDAYQAGIISYPRTESRVVSAASASKVVMLGVSCGLTGLDVETLASEGRIRSDGSVEQVDTHEALHPVLALSTMNSDMLKNMIRKPVRKTEIDWTRQELQNLMATIVSRRAFEAAREIEIERGIWRLDNAATVSPGEAELLADLDWQREKGFNFPWTRSFSTGVREWPIESVLLEMMAAEGLGRPSTYAGHIATATKSGEIESSVFPAPPRPTPQGMHALRKTPKSVWNPATCRMIETVMENHGNVLREDESAILGERARHRVMAWLARIPEEMRTPLIAALEAEGSGRDSGVSGPALSTPQTDPGPSMALTPPGHDPYAM